MREPASGLRRAEGRIFALAQPQATTLGKRFGRAREEHPGLSGFAC
jgi:hypothetical protein